MSKKKFTPSRIGKQPVVVPDKVTVQIADTHVTVKGPLGTLERTLVGVTLEQADGQILVGSESETKAAKSLHGLGRALLQNMVTGVSTGFKRTLEVVGVGYRMDATGNTIKLSLGYSHPVFFVLPDGVTAELQGQTKMTLSAVDKEILGQTAAKIRSLRPPEPYKGKGVRYSDEVVRRKAGKSAARA